MMATREEWLALAERARIAETYIEVHQICKEISIVLGVYDKFDDERAFHEKFSSFSASDAYVFFRIFSRSNLGIFFERIMVEDHEHYCIGFLDWIKFNNSKTLYGSMTSQQCVSDMACIPNAVSLFFAEHIGE
jgi:hypothetical protein